MDFQTTWEPLGAVQETLGMGATGLGCQPGLSGPVPGALMTGKGHLS